jgi:hypothetical protein
MTEPLRLAFTVRCPAASAFATWAEDFSRWWPLSHSESWNSLIPHYTEVAER